MKTLLMITMIMSCYEIATAQFENIDIGARAIGLNGAFTSQADNSLAVFYNPSGLGQMNYREVSVSYCPSPFGMKEISTAALTYAEPLKFGTIGAGVRTFGFDLYRETNVTLSYGNDFRGKIFYGLNANFYHLNIHNYNSALAFGADMGAMAYITDFLKWGFFAKNFTGAKIGESEEKLAQIYKTGFTAVPVTDVNFILEAEKDVRHPLSIRGGMEYFINEHVDIRAGVGTEPASFSGGVTISYNIFQLDYAIYNYRDLGITNQGSLTVNFGGSTGRKSAREQLKNAFK